MKNLIIGGSSGYDYNTLRPWVESINEVCDPITTDKVLVIGEATEDTRNKLTQAGFKLIQMGNDDMAVHVQRFIYIYMYLKEHWQEYNHVITTDVRDVYFQSDPFQWMKAYLDGHELVCGSECLRYKDEPWGNMNLYETYGPSVYEWFKDNEIYNVGVLGGTPEYLKDLMFNIVTNSINRPIKIVDQAVFNVLINTQPYKDVMLFAKMEDAWACQAGTTVDPHKIEHFRPNLLEPEPKWINNIAYTHDGVPFAIVHQYDRVPEWNRYVNLRWRS